MASLDDPIVRTNGGLGPIDKRTKLYRWMRDASSAMAATPVFVGIDLASGHDCTAWITRNSDGSFSPAPEPSKRSKRLG